MGSEPIDIIRGDHRVIDRLLERVIAAVASARSGGAVDPRAFRKVAEFLRLYVEGAHFAREQAMLLAMRGAGMPEDTGLLAQLFDEHAHGREQTTELCALAKQLERGGGEAGIREALLDGMDAYARMHRAHCAVEERHLLPLAQRLLKNVQQDALRSQFARVEARFGSLADAAAAVERAMDGAPKAARPRRAATAKR